LAPTESCDSDCPFCSVAGRPLKSYLPFDKIVKCLEDFRSLGAKALEITGGGNPLLYRDRIYNKNINNIIQVATDLRYDVGIITNSHDLRLIDKEVYDKINWIRVSLIQLDEGRDPEDYNFRDFPYDKLGFSYIIYDSTDGVPDELSRTKRVYTGTSTETIERIAKLVALHPDIKFIRIAGNCLIKGNNAVIRDKYKKFIDEIDKYGKFFIKDIGNDDSPYNNACYVGLVRPYIAPHPNGGDYQVYICTSHVLQHRTYDLNYSLGSVDNVISIWGQANNRFKAGESPYQVKGNKGANWESTCKYCYYQNNNQLLHTVATPLPDKNFA
jgi:hypothetical protein